MVLRVESARATVVRPTGTGSLAVLSGAALLGALRKRVPRLKKDAGARFALLAAIVAAAALILGERKRDGEKDKAASTTWWQRLASHPLGAWLLENGACVGMATASNVLVPTPRFKNYWSAFLTLFCGSVVMQWGAVGVQRFYSDTCYGHIASFSEGRPDWSLWRYVKEWASSNTCVDLFNAALMANMVSKFSRKQLQLKYHQRSFDPVKFLGKLAVVRFWVDVGFWLGHRALHHPLLYWIHRRHHEHSKPSLGTSFHFSPVDLWIEGVLPMILGLATLQAFQVRLTRFENSLLASYVLWHEVGSHCGKPMPCITYFPPLAPLYQLFLGDLDANNVKHHDVHHARLNCNYSIVIWPDMVMGTRIADHRDPSLAAGAPTARRN